MADSRNLAHRVEHLALAGGEHLNELLKSLRMGREIAVLLDLSAVAGLMRDVSADADTVAVALCDN